MQTVQIIFYTLVFLIIFEWLFMMILDYLNIKSVSVKLPKEAKDIYDEKEYKKSIEYEKTKFKFGFFSGTFSFLLMLICVLFGVFGKIYDYLFVKFSSFQIGNIDCSSLGPVCGGFSLPSSTTNPSVIFNPNVIFLTLIFSGILFLIQSILNLPFYYYSTFVIEKKFGFNKTTKKIFFLDFIKNLFLSVIIGGIILALITWLYILTGNYFWLLACIAITLFSVFMMMFYSSLIVPLFNKQTPLEKGELRDAIEHFVKKMKFKLDNIFVIDGSKRSNKANAYFAGIGPKKRIVLYDTLIKDMTTEEIVAVLAHEIGHYKKKHTLKMLVFSIIETALMFWILGLMLGNYSQDIYSALGGEGKIDTESIFPLGLLAFTILFTPFSMIFGIFGNILSRKHEYEADAYSAKHYNGKKLSSALKKLSKNNLTNLTPHPAYEFFHYSHPTVLKRIKALEK